MLVAEREVEGTRLEWDLVVEDREDGGVVGRKSLEAEEGGGSVAEVGHRVAAEDQWVE